MPNPKPPAVNLTEAERAELEKLVKRHNGTGSVKLD